MTNSEYVLSLTAEKSGEARDKAVSIAGKQLWPEELMCFRGASV